VAQIVTIQQQITLAGDWNQTLPPGEGAVALGVQTFPAAATGGLFEFGWESEFVLTEILQIAVDFNGAVTKNVAVKQTGVSDFILFNSTSGTENQYFRITPFWLNTNERIAISSTASGVVMYARVTARPAVAKQYTIP
jgi:hypothetical protein